ncbi:hypothetical protein F4815DRAFT_409496 [Daldinia loculata]|nr:hypothetical protein F4815DRAFT_409496 [Daldinia loculata]
MTHYQVSTGWVLRIWGLLCTCGLCLLAIHSIRAKVSGSIYLSSYGYRATRSRMRRGRFAYTLHTYYVCYVQECGTTGSIYGKLIGFKFNLVTKDNHSRYPLVILYYIT